MSSSSGSLHRNSLGRDGDRTTIGVYDLKTYTLFITEHATSKNPDRRANKNEECRRHISTIVSTHPVVNSGGIVKGT